MKKSLVKILSIFTAVVLSACGSKKQSAAPVAAEQPTANTSYIIFLTAGSYDANLGGISGADAKCAADLNAPGTGTYKALIVDGSTRTASPALNWVLKANATYTRADGTVIGTTNASQLFNLSLTNPFVGTSGIYYWTGLNSDFTTASSNLCTGWTSNDGVNRGMQGDSQYVDTNAIHNLIPLCSTTAPILCVEQ